MLKRYFVPFHSKDYLGFILKNSESAGYELRLYNKNGKQILSESMKGEYGNVKISGKEVLLFEGSKAVIFTKSGHKKFQGDLGMETTEIVTLSGTNQYLLLDANKAVSYTHLDVYKRQAYVCACVLR